MVLSTVKQALERMNIADATVTVGLSGGADSVCLLMCLKTLGVKIKAVHVHHMIRGAEADRDAAFAKELCFRHGVDFTLEKFDVPQYAHQMGLTLEQAARNARYEILRKHACGGLIAVAHNLNDQAETVLLRLTRGTGCDGLCAIKERNGDIIRPLLNVSRNQIEEHCRAMGWDYVTDSTNLVPDCSRNVIRLNVLSELEKINPAAVQGIARTASLMAQDADFLQQQAEATGCVSYSDQAATVDISLLIKLHPALQGRVLRAAIARVDSLVDIEQTHVSSLIRLCYGQSGKRMDLPRGVVALISGGFLRISRACPSARDISVPFCVGTLTLGEQKIEVTVVTSMGMHSKNVEYISLGDTADLTLRHRKEGDYIYPLGAGGKKSVKKYLIDKKVPLHERDSLVLVARGSHVLAIVGMTVDESAAVRDDKIYKIELKQRG